MNDSLIENDNSAHIIDDRMLERPLIVIVDPFGSTSAGRTSLVSYIERYDGINGMIRTDDFKIVINAKKNWDPLELQFPVDSVLPLT